jgi:hypothetical protein
VPFYPHGVAALEQQSAAQHAFDLAQATEGERLE